MPMAFLGSEDIYRMAEKGLKFGSNLSAIIPIFLSVMVCGVEILHCHLKLIF